MDIPQRPASAALQEQDVEGSLKIYRQVFNLCDKDGNGFITKEELAQICEQASDGDASGVLDNVLQCLKPNHEGHISFEEFKSGFQSFQRLHEPEIDSLTGMVTSTPSKLPSDHGNGGSSSGLEEVFESEAAMDETEAAWREVADRLDPVGALATTGVKDMWMDLYSKDPSLLENFECFLTEVLSELKQSDVEKANLEQHIRKITEQHSREVSEMDHLLQEELRQARANQEQNSASKTHRLSSHYNSLLEQREAVIGDMISQESDLKQALHHKTLTESQLREDKELLHSENLDLREQLISSHSTTPQHGSSDKGPESASEASLLTSGLETEPSAPSMTRLVMPTPPNLLDSDGSGYSLVRSQTEIVSVGGAGGMESGQPGLDQELASATQGQAINPELSLRLKAIQEDQDEDDIKYFPERGSAAEIADNPRSSQDISQGELKLEGNSTSPPLGTPPPTLGTPPPDTDSEPPETPSSARAVTVAHSSVQRGRRNLDALTYSGVMPRREDMPRPSPPELATINRVFKVIFLGDAGVGKTSLISRLTEGHFKTSVVSTVGLDFTTKTLRVGEERVMFQLWDTAGQERFKSALTPVYFRRADAFVIVYDVADRNTFKSIKKWISILKAALREQPPVVMLMGNKSDKVEEDRQVLLEEGRLLAVELQAMFSETSALSGDNVLQAHSTLAQLLLARENADLEELKERSLAARQRQNSKCSC